MNHIVIFYLLMLGIALVAWVGHWSRVVGWLKWVVLGVTGIAGIGCWLMTALFYGVESLPTKVHMPTAVLTLGNVLVFMGACALPALIPPVRRLLARWVFRGIDPGNVVHTWALFIFLAATVFSLLSMMWLYDPQIFIDSLKAMPLSQAAMLSMIAFVGFSVIASGFLAAGQGGRQTLRILGLTRLPLKACAQMIGLAFVLMIAAHGMEALLIQWVDPGSLHNLKQVLDHIRPPHGVGQTLLYGAAVGAAAGIGEEIIFRGLMQPLFGIVPTAILFTLIHTHYGFTPILLELLVIGCVLGWIRKRYNTTAAIIVHAFFDFFVISSSLLHLHQ